MMSNMGVKELYNSDTSNLSTCWTVRADAVTQEQAWKHMCTLHLLNIVDPVHWIIYLLPAWWKFYKRQKGKNKTQLDRGN